MGGMPDLTRRRSPDRADCWHVYFGDVQVRTIGRRAGVPHDAEQWGWRCGFLPASERGACAEGTATDFDQAGSAF